jgi:lipopolysaccharide transport protein LptA
MNTRLLTRLSTFSFGLLIACLGQQANAAAESENDSLLQDFGWTNDGEMTMATANNIRTVNLSENVVLTQGTLEIFGELAILEFDEPTQILIKATFYGTPVSYRQQLNTGDAGIRGSSDSIVLINEDSSGETVIELIGNAHIESPDSTTDCAAIVYLPNTELIRTATGPCAGSLNKIEK